MKKFQDPNYLVKLEKAISKKYGSETIENPRKHWTESDEEEYENQLNRELARRSCPVCKTYSFNLKDDAYMSKFECCFKCYIKHIQGTPEGEERWQRRKIKLQEKN